MAAYAIVENIIQGLVQATDETLEKEDIGYHAQVAIAQNAAGGQSPIVQILAIGRGVGIGEQIAVSLNLDEFQPNQARLKEVVQEIMRALEESRQKATKDVLSS